MRSLIKVPMFQFSIVFIKMFSTYVCKWLFFYHYISTQFSHHDSKGCISKFISTIPIQYRKMYLGKFTYLTCIRWYSPRLRIHALGLPWKIDDIHSIERLHFVAKILPSILWKGQPYQILLAPAIHQNQYIVIYVI